MSLMRKHKQRIIAEKEAKEASVNGVSMDGANEYELMLAKLGGDKNQLKKISSQITRNEKKAQLLPDYDAYVDGVLISDSGVQDDCLAIIMLWHIDCSNLERALEIAEYCIKHDVQMPVDFKRNLVTTVTEQIAEEAIKSEDSDLSEHLIKLAELTAEKDMLDEVRAKLYKALGLVHEASDPPAAHNYFELALKHDDGVGVKTKLKSLAKRIEKESQNQTTK